MKPIRQTLFLLLMCTLLAACAPATPNYIPIPPFELTATIPPSATPIAPPSAVPLRPTISIPTFTPNPSVTPILPTATATSTGVPKPSGFTPLFVQSRFDGTVFLLAGGVDDKDKWYSPSESVTALTNYINEGNSFDFYAPGQSRVMSVGQLNQTPMCVGTLTASAKLAVGGWVGVKRDWPVTFKSAQDLPVGTAEYVDVVNKWLIAQGLTAPEVKIQQVVRVDLEGDGPAEVLISAARFKETSGHMTELGDYSVVLLRKVAGNNVITIPLVSEVYLNPQADLTFPKTYSLVSVVDLNGDRIAEIVVDMAYWEGLGAMIFQVNQGKAIQVLKANCP